MTNNVTQLWCSHPLGQQVGPTRTAAVSMMGEAAVHFSWECGRERECRGLLWIHLEKIRQRGFELHFSTLWWVGEGEMKPSSSHKGTEKEQEATIRRGSRRSSCLVLRKSENPVKVLEPRSCEISSLWDFSEFNRPGCSCTCQTEVWPVFSWISGHVVQSFQWVFETVLNYDCRASVVLLHRSTGRLILNVLCGHLSTNLPGHVLMAHSCLGKLEKI